MDWWIAKQKTIPLDVDTVADLIAVLKKCPQDYKIRDADGGQFCEIKIATDGTDKEVELY